MATVGQAKSPNASLDEEDLGDLYDTLYPIRKKYKSFALQIKVKKSEIESIEAQYLDHGDRLLEVLTVCVRRTQGLTWALIDKALRSQSVGEYQLADRICRSGPSPNLEVTLNKGKVKEEQKEDSSLCTTIKEQKLKLNQVSFSEKEKSKTKGGISERVNQQLSNNEFSENWREKTSFDRETSEKIHTSNPAKGKRMEPMTEKDPPKAVKHAVTELQSPIIEEFPEYEDESSIASSSESEDAADESMEDITATSKPVTYEEETKAKVKVTGKSKVKGMKIAALAAPILSGDDKQSDPSSRGRDKKQLAIKPKRKKKSTRRRQWQSGMSLIARSNSSPSTSQEEDQPSFRGKRRETEHGSKQKRKNKGNSRPSCSEADDSSPECDMIKKFSEEEGKTLRFVFKRFFGQLCYEITDPVETAAQLLKNGLISQAVMKEMIMSPQSQQAKAITLISALDKKIKSHPENLFIFIEMLLKNAALMKTGEEILTETGKVCPDKVAALFSGPMLYSEKGTTSVGRQMKKRMQDIAEKHALQPTELPARTGGSSAYFSRSVPTAKKFRPVVSQSVPESSMSPVLTKYKQYLQSCYKARALAPADKYLPTLEAPYINLAMIRKERYKPEERDEFTRRTLNGGVDQILQNKMPICIEDLLIPEQTTGMAENKLYSLDSSSKLERPVKFILVEGPPGIGKSTFTWEVCRRWDEIEHLRHYHTVLLLRLREKWVLKATSIADLFRCEHYPEISKNISEELAEKQGQNLMLVLDGFDEVSHSFHKKSVLKKILCRRVFPECTIILTTRPSAKSRLLSICQPQVDRHVEIIGFTEEDRVKYITEVFRSKKELQANFLKYMFLVPHLKSMMYIPLNCAIIAQVYYECQSSHCFAIPKTRTELYRALTHSLLVRHMKMKESDQEFMSMLPESLNQKEMEHFKILAKFAFDSYHTGLLTKVTFFKEDVPDKLVHFGFMNVSTEMYASKGVEQTFSFLHRSLQEYLAAWHLADNYSIEFQVACHRMAVNVFPMYKGDNKEENKEKNEAEKALVSALWEQRSSLVEVTIFLAGITGWRCQSADNSNPWEAYLNHDTVNVEDPSVLLRSLYEAQNPTLLVHYFDDENTLRRNFEINSSEYTVSTTNIHMPYDCYALSYCLANCSNQFNLSICVANDDDVALVETFVKGLCDHCHEHTPLRVKGLELECKSIHSSNKSVLFLLTKANCWAKLEEMIFESGSNVSSDLVCDFVQTLGKLKLLHINSPTSWEWLYALKSFIGHKLNSFHITNAESQFRDNYEWTEAVLDVDYPSAMGHDICISIHKVVNSLLNSILGSNQITSIMLSNISRETMAGVRSLLLHCPCLATLELKKSRLGYDGILYICSALRKNTSLEHLLIHDDLQLPPSRKGRMLGDIQFTHFLSTQRVPLPTKTTCTCFLLQLNNIFKENTTLKDIKIESGAFLPLSAGECGKTTHRFGNVCGKYCEWTGLGPLQQFNVGAVGSGTSPNLRRSFSSSDLTQPQITLFWDRGFQPDFYIPGKIDFKKLLSIRSNNGKKLFCLPSFTAPDTEVLQSFSGLDPRLKECLEISHLDQYVERLSDTFWRMMGEIEYYML